MYRKHTTNPTEWHEQDWLLISEALEAWANDSVPSSRRWRANQLIFRIAEYIDLSELEFRNQTDLYWSGPRYRIE